MATKAFLLFPEKEDELVAIGDNPERLAVIISTTANVVKLMRQRPENKLFFDRENIERFLHGMEALLGQPYLADPAQQLRTLIPKTTTDIRSNSKKISGISYLQCLLETLTSLCATTMNCLRTSQPSTHKFSG